MVKKSIAEVRALREANTPIMFNMVAALEAIENTAPKVSHSSSLGDFSKELVDLFKQAGKQLALNQVVAAFKAAGKEITPKMAADRCWLLAKRGILEKGSEKGTYVIKSAASE